jgi:hypothetical protein
MRNVQLQLSIWCFCTKQSKRASTVPVNMIGVHLTCLQYVQAPNLGLSNFVKLNSNALALSCMIFRVIRADATEEGDTHINMNGFLEKWTKGEKNLWAMKLDMQFLDHHSKQFLDLQA